MKRWGDRLPIMLAFMSLFSALLTEHLGAGAERAILAPAVAVGIASVLVGLHG